MLWNRFRNNDPVINQRTTIIYAWVRRVGNVERWSAQLRNNIACNIAAALQIATRKSDLDTAARAGMLFALICIRALGVRWFQRRHGRERFRDISATKRCMVALKARASCRYWDAGNYIWKKEDREERKRLKRIDKMIFWCRPRNIMTAATFCRIMLIGCGGCRSAPRRAARNFASAASLRRGTINDPEIVTHDRVVVAPRGRSVSRYL